MKNKAFSSIRISPEVRLHDYSLRRQMQTSKNDAEDADRISIEPPQDL